MTAISANRFALLVWYYLDRQKRSGTVMRDEELMPQCGILPADVANYHHVFQHIFTLSDDAGPKTVDLALAKLKERQEVQIQRGERVGYYPERQFPEITWENLPFYRNGQKVSYS